MADMSELVERYLDVKKVHGFEGESGLVKFEKLLETLGYRSHGFRFGTVIENFLYDNSGAVEAIVAWIGEQNVSEWEEALEEELPPVDEEDVEDLDEEDESAA
jgi:hypothetical protein